MTTVKEAKTNNKSQMATELAAGVNTLSANQKITFTCYKKMVLPIDGFLFWVNCNLAHPSTGDPPLTLTVEGSLHYSTETEQNEDKTLSYNTIVFTALSPCDIFNEIDPQYIYLANYAGIRFGFNSQGKYYQQADLWHYVGVAVTSIIGTQVIDDKADFDALKDKLIVTNSLPYWLMMQNYTFEYNGWACPIKKIYPSYLVPNNELPPYAVVHIEDTKSLQPVPIFGRPYAFSSSQLVSEIARITTYGIDNDTIINFYNFVFQFSEYTNYIGMMNNMPTIRDEKHEQAEIQAIAQKKAIEFKISYLQSMHLIATYTRQLIRHVIVDFDVSNGNEITVTGKVGAPPVLHKALA
jgi:hypothetical protein